MKIDLVRWEHCARVGLDLSYYTGGAMLGVKNCVSHLYLVPNTSSPPLPPLTTIAISDTWILPFTTRNFVEKG